MDVATGRYHVPQNAFLVIIIIDVSVSYVQSSVERQSDDMTEGGTVNSAQGRDVAGDDDDDDDDEPFFHHDGYVPHSTRGVQKVEKT